MKTSIKVVLFLSLVLCFSCDNDNDSISIDQTDLLIGSWINPISVDDELKFNRASALKKNEYGISFLQKSTCVERSSGWCGTPPITFFDSQGTWTRKGNIITITIDNGMEPIKWEIKTLDDDYLIVELLR
jgi:hypothetical protein